MEKKWKLELLLGGWTTLFEVHIRQFSSSFPQGFGEKRIFETTT